MDALGWRQNPSTFIFPLLLVSLVPFAWVKLSGKGSGWLFTVASGLAIGWLLIRHAEVALEALPEATGDDATFYEGKVASARWFAKSVLPKAALRRRLAEEETGEIMDLPLEAF